MVQPMKAKFDKYWSDYSIILSLGAILDPRMKFHVLEYCLNKVDPCTANEKLTTIKKKLYLLFKAYSETLSHNASSNVSGGQIRIPTSREDDSLSFDVPDELRNINFQTNASQRKSSLDIYLEESTLDMNSKIDVLQYWRSQAHRFSDLASMACDVLSIPITTVASESAFSIGAHVLNKYRNSILDKNVQALICARNWIHGFEDDDAEFECQNESDKEHYKDKVDSINMMPGVD
ncbi:zinc finger BED domain-containing protein DAYSLEEPER-like [Arachis hypogaea]|uniref:zinc finger BED domain-containing protein DAYSLEEPER-like n=1 Tax=Arachis hypogaea TaxID=3818 RepID=UPI0007AF1195